MKLPHLPKGFSYGSRLNPPRDWLILLSLFFVLLVVSLLWNLWLFSKVTNGQAIGTATSTPVTATVNLTSVQALFGARAAEHDRYVSQYHFIDPSR